MKMIKEGPVEINGAAYTITSDSNSITWRSKPGTNALEKFYLFDSAGKCKIEKLSTGNNDDFQALLKATLSKRKYRWKEINLNQYVSKFSKGLLLEVQAINNNYSISFIKTNLGKQMYRMLMGKK